MLNKYLKSAKLKDEQIPKLRNFAIASPYRCRKFPPQIWFYSYNLDNPCPIDGVRGLVPVLSSFA